MNRSYRGIDRRRIVFKIARGPIPNNGFFQGNSRGIQICKILSARPPSYGKSRENYHDPAFPSIYRDRNLLNVFSGTNNDFSGS